MGASFVWQCFIGDDISNPSSMPSVIAGDALQTGKKENQMPLVYEIKIEYQDKSQTFCTNLLGRDFFVSNVDDLSTESGNEYEFTGGLVGIFAAGAFMFALPLPAKPAVLHFLKDALAHGWAKMKMYVVEFRTKEPVDVGKLVAGKIHGVENVRLEMDGVRLHRSRMVAGFFMCSGTLESAR
jgi:hypothetical protein